MDGDTVVVGAEGDDVGSNTDQGSAYVFVRPPGGWAGLLQENARLVASDGAGSDRFGGGGSVAVDGDTVVVGADGADVEGAAYVFVKPPGGWAGLLQENAKLFASDGEINDFLGTSVAISGDTVVARAPSDDIGPNIAQGSAYVFVKPAGGWAGVLQESAKLVASDGAPDDGREGDEAGSVAVSGDTVVVGVEGDDIGPTSDQGSAYVFVRPAGGWAGLLQENAKLTASDGTTNSAVGVSVGVSGDTVVVGSVGANLSRQAYVFVEPPGGWAGALQENARLTRSDALLIGFSVGISGDTVVVSPDVYFKPAGGWTGVLTENGRLTIARSSGAFLAGVGVDGNTVVQGFCDNDDLGSACVFEGLDTVGAVPAAPRTNCSTATGCSVPITCNLSQNCENRIRLLVRARDVRLSQEARARAPRLIRLAAASTNIPPGATEPVRLKLTKRGRDIVKNNKKRRLKGIIEIRNAPGTAFDRRPITIRLR